MKTENLLGIITLYTFPTYPIPLYTLYHFIYYTTLYTIPLYTLYHYIPLYIQKNYIVKKIFDQTHYLFHNKLLYNKTIILILCWASLCLDCSF